MGVFGIPDGHRDQLDSKVLNTSLDARFVIYLGRGKCEAGIAVGAAATSFR
jgi:hypothetical protein